MDKEKSLVVFGSIASVILLVLYFTRNGQSGGGGSLVEQVYEVSGITPEVAAIRSQERIAKIEADKTVNIGWFEYLLGKIQTDAAQNIALAETDAGKFSALVSGDTARIVSGNETEAKKFSDLVSGDTARIVSKNSADAATSIANYATAVNQANFNVGQLNETERARLSANAQTSVAKLQRPSTLETIVSGISGVAALFGL